MVGLKVWTKFGTKRDPLTTPTYGSYVVHTVRMLGPYVCLSFWRISLHFGIFIFPFCLTTFWSITKIYDLVSDFIGKSPEIFPLPSTKFYFLIIAQLYLARVGLMTLWIGHTIPVPVRFRCSNLTAFQVSLKNISLKNQKKSEH